jgi:hypothetical protein
MADKPKKPSSMAYKPGEAPEIGAPPIRRGTGEAINSPINRIKVPHLYSNGNKSFGEDQSMQRIDYNNLTVTQRTHFDEGTLAYRKDLIDTLHDKDLQDRYRATENKTNNRAQSRLWEYATDKRRLGDMAAEEYATTGKTGGPLSTLAASSIQRLKARESKLYNFLNPMEKLEARASISERNIIKSLEDDKKVIAPDKAASMEERSNRLSRLEGKASDYLGDRMDRSTGLPSTQQAKDYVEKVANSFRRSVARVGNVAGKLGKGLGIVGEISMAADAANALVPIREKPAEMKSLDALQAAAIDENNQPRTY